MNKNANLPFWSINLHPEEFIEMKIFEIDENSWVFPKGEIIKIITPKTKFRVNEAVAKEKLEAIVDLGAKYVRTDFAWNFIQPFSPEGKDMLWNKSALKTFQEYLQLLKKYNLELICILFRSPEWFDKLLFSGKKSEVWQAFYDYSFKVASLFGSQVKYYQLWNEPNNFVHDSDAGNKCDFYAELMLQGDRAVRDSKIGEHTCSMNIMANNDNSWQNHLEQYFTHLNSHDPYHTISVIGIDHYPGTWSLGPDSWHDWRPLDAVVKLVKGNSFCAGKTIAIMETGYASRGHWPIVEADHHQEGQEQWINDSLNLLLHKTLLYNKETPGMITFFNWYELQDGEVNPKDIWGFEHNFGIQSKIGYDSLKRAIGSNTQNLTAAYLTGEGKTEFFCRTSNGQLACYTIDQNGNTTVNNNFLEAGFGTGDISCVYNEKRKHADVFIKASDKYLHYFFYDGNKWNWGTQFIFSEVFGTLATVFNKENSSPEIFFKGKDGNLYFSNPNKGWAHDIINSPEKGGKVSGAIAAIYNENRKHAEVFFKSRHGYLEYFFFENGIWKWGGESFCEAGEVKGDVAATYNQSQQQPEVFFKGYDFKLYHFYIENGIWTKNFKLPVEKPLGEIAAIYNPMTMHSEIFFMGDKGLLKHIYFEEGNWVVEEKSFLNAPLIEGGITAQWTGQTIEVIYRSRQNSAVRFYKINNDWNYHIIDIE